jgi:N-acetylmuramoyl-L-alanine amidase
VLEARALNATFLVDKDGKAYQILDSLYELPSTAYGTNEKCVQMEIVGKDTEDLISNEVQIAKVLELTKELSIKFNFPLSNQRIESFHGVYSHTQAKKKFGGSIYLTGKDFDPGEAYMELILTKAGGTYFPEKDWYDRQGNNWVILDRKFQP